MNRPIRTLAIGCLVLFAALLININYVQVFQAGDLNDQSANKRARDAECSRDRGPILVDGDTVARSVDSDDSLKFQRTYSQPKLYSPVTGFFSCFFGTTGIEDTENSILSGSDGRLFVNRVIDLVGNNQPQGGSVLLTIDPAAQQAAADGLEALPGEAKGAVVALDPQTGAILAMVSTPSFDPNKVASHDFDVAQKAYESGIDDPDKKMRNRGTQEIYPPGSTFKIVMSAAALANGYTSDSQFQGGASYDLPGSSDTIKNEGGGACNPSGGKISLRDALVISCNVAFADLGNQLGDDVIREQAEKFGFDEDVLDELPSVPSRFCEDPDEPQTALCSIGQFDVVATPLQMAMVAAGVANGGEVMKPYIVQEVRSPDLDVLDEADPEVLHEAMTESAADELTQMMVDVVDFGTGGDAAIEGMSVAGKTGTANTTPDQPPYAWMVTFAPAENPQVAVAVFVESSDTPRDDIRGGGMGGPIARAVMQAVIDQ